MFYIKRRTQHILFTAIWSWKEGNVLFNDTLNTLFTVMWSKKEGNDFI